MTITETSLTHLCPCDFYLTKIFIYNEWLFCPSHVTFVLQNASLLLTLSLVTVDPFTYDISHSKEHLSLVLMRPLLREMFPNFCSSPVWSLLCEMFPYCWPCLIQKTLPHSKEAPYFAFIFVPFNPSSRDLFFDKYFHIVTPKLYEPYHFICDLGLAIKTLTTLCSDPAQLLSFSRVTFYPTRFHLLLTILHPELFVSSHSSLARHRCQPLLIISVCSLITDKVDPLSTPPSPRRKFLTTPSCQSFLLITSHHCHVTLLSFCDVVRLRYSRFDCFGCRCCCCGCCCRCCHSWCRCCSNPLTFFYNFT